MTEKKQLPSHLRDFDLSSLGHVASLTPIMTDTINPEQREEEDVDGVAFLSPRGNLPGSSEEVESHDQPRRQTTIREIHLDENQLEHHKAQK